MPQTINTRMTSMRVQKNPDSSKEQSGKFMQRSGSDASLNMPTTDAIALPSAKSINASLRTLNSGIRNASEGISMAQIAEGGLQKIGDLLQRMRELALLSAGSGNAAIERDSLDSEFKSLNSDIARVASSTSFNGKRVLATDGGFIDYQVGSSTDEANILSLETIQVNPVKAHISTISAALAAVEAVDTRIVEISDSRADFDAVQQQLESVIENLQKGAEHKSAGRGRISNTDFAMETAVLVRSQIVQQASTATMSQANVSSQNVRQLLE
ncbi:MAG: flagellin [Granulosicoccus sp.]